MTKEELVYAIEHIESQIFEFDWHKQYDIFSQNEVAALRKRKMVLEKELAEIKDD